MGVEGRPDNVDIPDLSFPLAMETGPFYAVADFHRSGAGKGDRWLVTPWLFGILRIFKNDGI